MAHLYSERAGWDDEREKQLRELLDEELSAQKISDRFAKLGFKVTRNAVIGKVKRMGLQFKSPGAGRMKHTVGQIRAPRKRKPAQAQAKPTPPPQTKVQKALFALNDNLDEPFTIAPEAVEIPVNERKTLQDLTETSCRWPIGDPLEPDFHFCNEERLPGLPYCEAHCRRAYDPVRTNKNTVATTKPGYNARPTRRFVSGAPKKVKEKV